MRFVFFAYDLGNDIQNKIVTNPRDISNMSRIRSAICAWFTRFQKLGYKVITTTKRQNFSNVTKQFLVLRNN